MCQWKSTKSDRGDRPRPISTCDARLLEPGPISFLVAEGVGPVMVVVAAAEGALQQRQQGPRPVQSREGVLW